MSLIKIPQTFLEPNQRLTIKKEVDLGAVNRILVFGIDQLGGLMTGTPFYRELRKAFPDARIVNLVGPLTYGVMQNCPYVDDVWLFDKSKTFETIKKIRAESFDLTFQLSGTLRTGLMVYLAGIPHRVGYDVDGTGPLLTVKLHQEFHSRYRVENIYDFLRALGFDPQGIYDREVWLSEADREYARSWVAINNPQGNKTFLAFNPFSTDVKRRWTDQGWRDLLRALLQRGITPIMFVAPNEVEAGKTYVKNLGLDEINVETHQPTQTAAILQNVKFAVGPESGFIHMALAVNKPHVIAFYNVLPAKATFPNVKHHVALSAESLNCCPCYLYKAKDICPNDLACMKQLSFERVLEAIDRFS